MRICVHHHTRYRFSSPARTLVQVLRMTPQPHDGQKVVDWHLDLDCDARMRTTLDAYGNIVHRLFLDRPTGELTIDVQGEVETRDSAGIMSGTPEPLPPAVFLRTSELASADADISRFARDIAAGAGQDPLGRLHALNVALHRQVAFMVGTSDASTTAAQAFAAGAGVCQDLAHILIAAARTLGIPARYVSGQLLRRDGHVSQEAGHAWAEAFVPALGWVAFDPAHGICTDDAYVRIAVGLDYRDAAPVSGVRFGGGEEELTVDITVREAQGILRQSQ